MKNYIYDGSFNGLLTCIWHHYYNHRAAGIFTEDQYQCNMLIPPEAVVTDEEKAEKVYNAIRSKISYEDLRRIYKVFMSCTDEKEMIILRYLVLGFKTGSKVSMLHGNPIVHAAEAAELHIGNEIHRLKGLIRFRRLSFGAESNEENNHDCCDDAGAYCDNCVVDSRRNSDNDNRNHINSVTVIGGNDDIGNKQNSTSSGNLFPDSSNSPFPDSAGITLSGFATYDSKSTQAPEAIYYSDISPKNDVVEFLAHHFCQRFREQTFIIHDVSRSKALFASNRSWYVDSLTKSQIPSASKGDLYYQRLWQGYFDKIAIKERTNPRCQKNFMPMRYWEHLTEMRTQK